MVFKLELSDNSIFKNAFESISKIVDEVMCEMDSEGFRLTALDRSHITFVSLDLKAEVFDEYECSIPQKICIDTVEFMKILKRCKNNDILGLSIDDNTGSLVIDFKGEVNRTFKIRLIDMEYESPMPPSIQPPSTVNMESSLLKDCLTDMELFGDNLYFSIDSDYFYADSTGEFGDSNFKYLHGESDIIGKVKSKFSIAKLKDILSASKFSDVVELNIGDNMPLVLRFKLDTDDGLLMFLLAPMIEEVE